MSFQAPPCPTKLELGPLQLLDFRMAVWRFADILSVFSKELLVTCFVFLGRSVLSVDSELMFQSIRTRRDDADRRRDSRFVGPESDLSW